MANENLKSTIEAGINACEQQKIHLTEELQAVQIMQDALQAALDISTSSPDTTPSNAAKAVERW